MVNEKNVLILLWLPDVSEKNDIKHYYKTWQPATVAIKSVTVLNKFSSCNHNNYLCLLCRCVNRRKTGRRDHISLVLRQLHWLPVQRRIDYKLACFVFSSLSGHAPPYLADDIHLVSESHRRRLRSSTDRSCAVPRIHNTLISATGASLLPGHVFGSVFPPTCVTRTLHTAVSGVNSKRFVASGVQWLFKNTLTYILTHFQFLLTTQVHQMET